MQKVKAQNTFNRSSRLIPSNSFGQIRDRHPLKSILKEPKSSFHIVEDNLEHTKAKQTYPKKMGFVDRYRVRAWKGFDLDAD
ncbi:MAG: hypothetical protein JHC93_07410 [Parachlamydiales bacterium]|nr:hypothetical protein [Parachlamydiales bacterium]